MGPSGPSILAPWALPHQGQRFETRYRGARQRTKSIVPFANRLIVGPMDRISDGIEWRSGQQELADSALHEYSPYKGILLHLVSRRSAVRHVAHTCSFVGFSKPRGLLSHSGLPRCLSVCLRGHRRNPRGHAVARCYGHGSGEHSHSATQQDETKGMLTMLRHNTLLNAGLTKMGLRSIVNDGVPPTLMRVRELFPDASSEELIDYWQSAMIQYQRENAKLFDVIYDTIDLASEWETIDLEHIQESFILNQERDGNGLLKWIRSFHDLNSDALPVSPCAMHC